MSGRWGEAQTRGEVSGYALGSISWRSNTARSNRSAGGRGEVRIWSI